MVDALRIRVARIIASGAHALLDRIEDAAPVAILEQSVREVESLTDEVRGELGRTVANRHLAKQQHQSLNKEHESLGESIASALEASREDLAKPAISRQIDIEVQLPVLESNLGDLAQQEAELSGFVDALLSKKREMESAIRAFENSQKSVVGVGTLSGSAGNVQSKLSAAQSVFDRTYHRQTGLDAAGRGASLEQTSKIKELNDLMRENKINERLAALKSK